MRLKRMLAAIGLGLVGLLALSGCAETPLTPAVSEERENLPLDNGAGEEDPDVNLPDTDAGQEDIGEDTAAGADFTPLPAVPNPVGIPTQDDRVLEGLYYPAKVPNAPVIVLMHWANGSMDDWQAVAPWLQNRLDELDELPGGGQAYLDPSWFPPMPEEVSFAVLVFNFGDFGNSPYGGSRGTWVDDAVAALNYASTLADVNPHGISTLGASIGADGAVDGCYLFNDAGEMGTCLGALSLSPGNYLTNEFDYREAAEFIELSGFPVWCLAADGDDSSPDLCRGLDGVHARAFIFAGRDHGMNLLTDDQTILEPALDEAYNPIQMIQEFLETVYGISLNDVTIP